MCSVCRQTPCNPSCPNAPEPIPVHTCVECGFGIYAGDKFWDSPNGPVCEDCLDDMAAETILTMLGESVETAEVEEYDNS